MDVPPEDPVSVSVAFGTLSRGLLSDVTARLVGVEMGEIVTLGAKLHDLKGGALRFYGESMVASALLSAQIKGKERLTVQIQCERPNIGFVCDVRGDGATRGRVNPRILPELNTAKFQGVLLAIKSVGSKEVYRGVTAIDKRSIAEALSTHLSDSQQVQSALRIHVSTGPDGRQMARGLLIERLPGGSDDDGVDYLQDLDAAVQADDFDATLTDLCARGEETVLGHQALFWQCQCSQERVETVIRMLGAETLGEMVADEEESSVNCHFCNTTRTVSVGRLRELLALSES